MKILIKGLGLLLVMVMTVVTVHAQRPDNMMTESGAPLMDPNQNVEEAPLDDIVDNSITVNKRVLPYDEPRGADVIWKKKVWRIIDIREKMNLSFAYPKRPFLTILIDAIKNPENPMRVFSDEGFENRMDTNTVNKVLFDQDTVTVTDPVTYEEKIEVVNNDLNVNDVKRFRIKEIWYFDKQSSTMRVRILGIAPVIPERTDSGELIGERALFWVYYPDAREALSRERVFSNYNDASPLTWDDIFQMRFFSSYIYKESNVQDVRLQDKYTGRELLLEAQKIKQEIFNFEQDLWSY